LAFSANFLNDYLDRFTAITLSASCHDLGQAQHILRSCHLSVLYAENWVCADICTNILLWSWRSGGMLMIYMENTGWVV